MQVTASFTFSESSAILSRSVTFRSTPLPTQIRYFRLYAKVLHDDRIPVRYGCPSDKSTPSGENVQVTPETVTVPVAM